MEFLPMVFRLIIAFFSFMLYLRIYGMMELAPQSNIDQVSIFVLGGIIGGVVYDTNISILQFVMAIFIWSALSLTFQYLRGKNLRLLRILDGSPLLLMENNKLIPKNIEKAHISVDDLMALIHEQGISSIKELKTIWLETNGQLTIIKKDGTDIPFVLIESGQINEVDLKRSGQDKQWLEEELSKRGHNKIHKIYIAEYFQDEFEIHTYN